MGWPSEFFVSGAPREMFTCKICLDVLDDPMDANCDEQHVFCRTCLDGWFDARPDGAACPTCNEGLRRDAVRPAKSIRRLVGELHASCQYGKDGCDWTGALSNRADHIAQCPLALRQCRGCEAECRLKDLQAHEAACDKVRRPCPNADIGCPDEVTDPEREEHLRTCRQRCRERLEQARIEAQQQRERADAAIQRVNVAQRLTEASRNATAFMQGHAFLPSDIANERHRESARFTIRLRNFAEERGKGAAHVLVLRDPSGWEMSVYPNGNSMVETSTGRQLGVYLRRSASAVALQSDSQRISYAITLLNENRMRSKTMFGVFPHVQAMKGGMGSPQFIPLDLVSNPASGFLHEGDLSFQVTVKISAIA